jgi:hypothetical protein
LRQTIPLSHIIVQDISLATDNILFRKEKYYSSSAGHLSKLLIKNHSGFETEKKEVYDSGLKSSPWQHFDQTGARVGGVNYTTNVICNPL